MKRLAMKDWFLLTGATAAVLGISLMAKSQQTAFAQENAQEEGRIVQIGPDAELGDDLPMADEQTQTFAAPDFWIGVSGRRVESPVLRTHLQLAEDMGVVIEAVVPGGPAEKAGLRKHDVVIGVNGEPAIDMTVLQEAVLEGDGKAVELKIIRLAKETTIEIAPEKPPADFADQVQRSGGMQFQVGPGGQIGDVQKLLEQLQQGGFRNIGPGMVFQGQRRQMENLPDGVTVSITRDGEGPAKITVKQGNQTWTVEGDDEEAIAKLPENLQPMVRRMIDRNRGGGAEQWLEKFDFGRNLDGLGELEQILPDKLGNFDFGEMGRRGGALRERADSASEQMLERMEQLEKRIEQLQQRRAKPRRVVVGRSKQDLAAFRFLLDWLKHHKDVKPRHRRNSLFCPFVRSITPSFARLMSATMAFFNRLLALARDIRATRATSTRSLVDYRGLRPNRLGPLFVGVFVSRRRAAPLHRPDGLLLRTEPIQQGFRTRSNSPS